MCSCNVRHTGPCESPVVSIPAHIGCVCEECMPHTDPNTPPEPTISEVQVDTCAGFPVMALSADEVDEILHQTTRPGGANSYQPGGDHYIKHDIQPWDAIVAWGLGFLDGNVVKYVARYKSKGGLEDLKKARHYLDKLIEVESGR